MAFENKEKHGGLFPIEEKKSENSPDATGKIKIGGVDYDVAAWSKTSQNGKKYFSLKLQEPESHESSQNQKSDNSDGDNLPF